MATVYKRTQRKPIPEGAEIVERGGERFAVWKDSAGRHKARLAPDGKAILLDRPGYEIQWFDENGKRRKESVRCGDRDTAEQIAAEREKAAMMRAKGLIDPAQERFAQHGRRPLAEHLTDFEGFLTAKQNTPKHVQVTRAHIQRVFDHCPAASLADLTGPAVLGVIGQLRTSGASLRTCNSYLRSIKSFTRWLWKHKRAADDPLCALGGFNEETDPRHVRRELTPDEAVRLIDVARRRPLSADCLQGEDRAMVYRLALGTGFRAKELRSLTPASFHLDADPPTVTVTAAHSKRRRTDIQPIRRDLADLLRPWLAGHPADEKLFARLPGDTARMMRSDLVLARQAWLTEAATQGERKAREQSDFLKYENAAGEVADFHAQRHTYISGIVAGGASVKTAQELARHSTPSLTIGRYSHARLHDLEGALAALPVTGGQSPSKEPEAASLRATGMEGAVDGPDRELRTCDQEPWGHFRGQLGGRGWQQTAENTPPTNGSTIASTPSEQRVEESSQTLALSRNDNRQQPLAGAGGKRRRPDSNRGWWICNPLP